VASTVHGGKGELGVGPLGDVASSLVGHGVCLPPSALHLQSYIYTHKHIITENNENHNTEKEKEKENSKSNCNVYFGKRKKHTHTHTRPTSRVVRTL
jgi:hypothetical protein